MVRPISLCLALLALPLAPSQAAEPVIYGPDGAPTVVQNKLYTMTGRTELGFAAVTSINGALVDHYGGLLTVTHHPNEWFDFGAEVAANYAGLSGLSDQVRSNLPARVAGDLKKDEIANVAQLRLFGAAVARLAPFYGKFNLAAELPIHFQAFGLLGGGAGLFHHESVNFCATQGTAACQPGGFLTSDSVKPAGLLGIGFRFYFNDRWSLRTELRAYLFPDTYRMAADITNPANTGADQTYLGVLTTLAVGVSTLF